jgi:hypothetical protein
MRIYNHNTSIIAILVMLTFVGGSIGCRSNGGPWYNPKSYTLSNPFDKSRKDSDTLANTKPSLGSNPNVSTPAGGYTSGNYSLANKNDAAKFHSDRDALANNPYSLPQSSENKLAAAPAPYGGSYESSYNSYNGTTQVAAPTSTPNYTYPGSNAVQQDVAANAGVYSNQPSPPTNVPQAVPQYAPTSAYTDSANYAPFSGSAPVDNTSVYATPYNTATPAYGTPAPAAGQYAVPAPAAQTPPVANAYGY